MKKRFFTGDADYLGGLVDKWLSKKIKCYCYSYSVISALFDKKTIKIAVYFRHKPHTENDIEIVFYRDFYTLYSLKCDNYFSKKQIKILFNEDKKTIEDRILYQTTDPYCGLLFENWKKEPKWWK